MIVVLMVNTTTEHLTRSVIQCMLRHLNKRAHATQLREQLPTVLLCSISRVLSNVSRRLAALDIKA